MGFRFMFIDKPRKIKMASYKTLKERYEIEKILGERSGHQTLLTLVDTRALKSFILTHDSCVALPLN